MFERSTNLALQRSIGLTGLTFVAVSGIIGSGWLFAPMLTAQVAGPGAVISWLIGGTAMLLLTLCFAEIVALLPVAGGIARIPHFTHGDLTSMMLGWTAWVGYNTAAPIGKEGWGGSILRCLIHVRLCRNQELQCLRMPFL